MLLYSIVFCGSFLMQVSRSSLSNFLTSFLFFSHLIFPLSRFILSFFFFTLPSLCPQTLCIFQFLFRLSMDYGSLQICSVYFYCLPCYPFTTVLFLLPFHLSYHFFSITFPVSFVSFLLLSFHLSYYNFFLLPFHLSFHYFFLLPFHYPLTPFFYCLSIYPTTTFSIAFPFNLSLLFLLPFH